MKTICAPDYHRDVLLATHALGHIKYSFTLLVLMNQGELNKQNK